eukprot:TRINITY_DN82097_c0_g1_i1.p1 TRINITY_DN82097_c0_g1~~TRINITY_DN82097_c0_g1_i1.p1  ORF type:complete len:415 (-),score=90.15 TRINITY_DN82097_c0_g1_i1:60-1256(-)
MGASIGHAAASVCSPTSEAAEPAPSPSQCSERTPRFTEETKSEQSLESQASSHQIALYTAVSFGALQLVHGLGLQVLRSAHAWALLCMTFFWLWYFSGSDASGASAPQVEVAQQDVGGVDRVEGLASFLAALEKQLDEKKPPTDSLELKAANWQDISTTKALCFVKCVKTPVMKTQVCMDIQTKDQAEYFPWVLLKDGHLAGGTIPIFLALEHWPLWFPFCQKVQKVVNIDACSSVYYLRFKIAFITADMIMLASLVDKLDSTGSVELLFATPPANSEGSQWMGAMVPQKLTGLSSVRVTIPSMRLSMRPGSLASGQFIFQAETLDEIQVPWVTKLFWQACGNRLIGLIMSMQNKYSGSVLEAHFSKTGKEAEETRNFYQHLYSRIERCCKNGKRCDD